MPSASPHPPRRMGRGSETHSLKLYTMMLTLITRLTLGFAGDS
jgi:hypothetical protein